MCPPETRTIKNREFVREALGKEERKRAIHELPVNKDNVKSSMSKRID